MAYVPCRPEFRPQPTEVAELLEVPISHFLDESNIAQEEWFVSGAPRQIPYYLVGGHKVWGATAMVLAELAAVMASSSDCCVWFTRPE